MRIPYPESTNIHTGLEGEPDATELLLRSAGTGPFPAVPPSEEEPTVRLSETGIFREIGHSMDPPPAARKSRAQLDANVLMKTTGLENRQTALANTPITIKSQNLREFQGEMLDVILEILESHERKFFGSDDRSD